MVNNELCQSGSEEEEEEEGGEGVTAKEASLAAANLGIHPFIIPQNQSTNAV